MYNKNKRKCLHRGIDWRTEVRKDGKRAGRISAVCSDCGETVNMNYEEGENLRGCDCCKEIIMHSDKMITIDELSSGDPEEEEKLKEIRKCMDENPQIFNFLD